MGGRGSGFLLWGEPGVRRVWGVDFFPSFRIETWANQAGLELLFQNGKMGYFCSGRGPNQIDRWAAKGQASCCGVNLAAAGFRGVDFFRVSLPLLRKAESRPGPARHSQAKSKTNARSP